MGLEARLPRREERSSTPRRWVETWLRTSIGNGDGRNLINSNGTCHVTISCATFRFGCETTVAGERETMSLATRLPRTMGRKPKGGGAGPPTVAVKIDRGLATKARWIAADKGVDAAAYLSDAIRAVGGRDGAQLVRRVGTKNAEGRS